MDTQKLIRGLREWQDSEEPSLPTFNTPAELAYFIVRANNTLDVDEMTVLMEDLEEVYIDAL